ncbi:MAG: hypothetical protein ABSE49_15525, partial [Polyangiaceae bacterium]
TGNANLAAAQAAAVCPPVANWDGVATELITSPTPGATLCVSLNGNAATCSAGACTGKGNLTVTPTSGTSLASLVVLADGSGAGCGAATNPPTGTFCEVTSGTTVQATACSTTLPAPATATTANITLQTSPLVFTPAAGTLACNTPVTVTEDTTTTATLSAGGATGDEYICYTTNGKAPTEDTNCCADSTTDVPRCAASTIGKVSTSGTTCKQVNSVANPIGPNGTQFGAPYSNAAGNQTKPSIPLTSSAGIQYATCVPNGSYTNTGAGESGTVAYTVGAYVHSPTLQVDGNLGDWVGVDSVYTAGTFSNQNGEATNTWVPGAPGTSNGAAGPQGFFTYDATNAYFGLSYCQASSGAFGAAATACGAGAPNTPPVSSTWLAVYIGSNPGSAANGAFKDLPLMDGLNAVARAIAPAAGVKWAFQWQTTAGSGTAAAFNWNGSAWVANAGIVVTAAYSSGLNTVEFSVPLAQLGGTAPTTLTAAGSLVSAVTSGNSTELFRYPGDANHVTLGNITGQTAGYVDFFDDTLATCGYPNLFAVTTSLP